MANNFCRVGLCKDISAQALIAMLESWSNENKAADIKLLIKIYQKLADDKQVNLTEQLADKALIYCPSGKHNWCQINQAIWQDHHDVFHDSYHWLSQFYSEKLKKFWVDDIGIAESVEPEHFAQAWLKLQKLRIKDDGEVVRAILQSLHRELISYARLADSEERTETWWLTFKNKAKCFTVQGTWLDKRKVYVGDLDTSNTKVFKNAGVPLFWRESGRSNSHYEPLYQALALPRLSSSVSLSLAKQQGLQAPSHSFLTNSTKHALAYFVRDCAIRCGNESVEWLSDNRVLQAILMADENVAPQHRLLVQALVGDYKVQLTQHAYFDIELRKLIYVADNDRDSQKEAIAIELARLLFPNEYKQAEDTIFKLLEISSDKRLEQIRQRKDWGAKFVKDENKLIQRLLQGMPLTQQDDELNAPDSQPENVSAKELVLPIALDNGKTMQISSNSNEVNALSADTLNTFTSSSAVKSPSNQDYSQQVRAAEQLSCDEFDMSYPRSGSQFDTASRLKHNPVRAINDGILATPMHKRSLGTRLSTITSRDISGNALSHQEEHQQEEENNRNTGMRFISYVNPKADEVAYNPQLTGQAKAIGDEAEKLVVKALADLGYQPKHLGGNNPGYDIEAINPLTGEIIFVEVKGIRGAWNHTGVALSASQASICRQYTDNFWLVVVENLASTPLLHMLVNPLNKIDKYYFDQNWAAVAEEMTAL
ncbi:DUF3883 domain-containing protein [Shewanella sp. 1CM18E]|uniref:DUF3883 domain-containing protein n=1 Tax=Shewanella sp. 1CM18E TaxID=2929169 RepID=UPI0020BD68AE|nr:DUF3883 domain-containing protein [Shewanella sp. 1CM18E]MCK8045333.1 DUF3883 domain-containing protein [Shewanella sp. 1CM18E]